MRRMLTLVVLLGSTPAVAIAQGTACRAADSVSHGIINKLKRLMDVDGGRVAHGKALAGIPNVDPASITVVTNETICSKAEKAYTTALSANSSTPSGKVYVIQVGNVYVVQDPQRKGGEFVAEVVMDSQFRVLSKSLA